MPDSSARFRLVEPHVAAKVLDGEAILINLANGMYYSLAETGWKKVLVPAVLAGVGASFLVQATYFTKQLVEGEKEFEE